MLNIDYFIFSVLIKPIKVSFTTNPKAVLNYYLSGGTVKAEAMVQKEFKLLLTPVALAIMMDGSGSHWSFYN